MRYPSPFLAVDKTLYPYRGHEGIKQYNPSKPAKYGLSCHSLCYAVVLYTYFTHSHVRKPSQISEESSKHYVKVTDKYTKYLVNGASEYTSLSGCSISLDQYFTSVSLTIWVIDRGLTLIVTIRLGRRDIPKEIKSLEHKEEKSTIYGYAKEQNIMLVSYIDKKSLVRKILLYLQQCMITWWKPDVHVTYDHANRGVDIVDLISNHNSTRMKQKRWQLNTFAFLLDTIRTNAKTILSESQSHVKLSGFEFIYHLGKMLVLTNMDRR